MLDFSKALGLCVNWLPQKITLTGIGYLGKRLVCLLGSAAVLICALILIAVPSILYSSEKYTPKNKFAYVTNNELDGVITVVDTVTSKIIDTIKVGAMPLGIAITPDEKLAYVTHLTSKNIMVIDMQTNTVIKTIETACT